MIPKQNGNIVYSSYAFIHCLPCVVCTATFVVYMCVVSLRRHKEHVYRARTVLALFYVLCVLFLVDILICCNVPCPVSLFYPIYRCYSIFACRSVYDILRRLPCCNALDTEDYVAASANAVEFKMCNDFTKFMLIGNSKSEYKKKREDR